MSYKLQNKLSPTDREDVYNSEKNMSDYFKSSTNQVAYKSASEVLTNKIHNVFSDVFQEYAALKETSHYRSKKVIGHVRYFKEGIHMCCRNP